MDLTFITDMYIPLVLLACLVIGYILKKWIQDVDNKSVSYTHLIAPVYDSRPAQPYTAPRARHVGRIKAQGPAAPDFRPDSRRDSDRLSGHQCKCDG